MSGLSHNAKAIEVAQGPSRPVCSYLPRHHYLPALDGIRALSMGYVMINHLASLLGKSQGGWMLALLIGIGERGWFGVDVFFVLSGFLITWILADEMEATGTVSFRRFYLRRVLRLVPTYYSAIVLGLALSATFSGSDFRHLLHSLVLLLTYILNLAVASGFRSPAPLGVAWSLCIEEQFYLLWPLLLLFLGQKGALKLALSVVIAVLAWRTGLYLFLNNGHFGQAARALVTRIQFATDTRIDVILIGCSLALAMRLGKLPRLWQMLKLPWAGMCSVAILGTALAAFGDIQFGAPHLFVSITAGYTVMALCVAFCLAAIVGNPAGWLSTLLGSRPLVFLGGISYGGYLFHAEILYFLTHSVKLYYPTVLAVPAPITAFCVVAFFAGTIALSYYHFDFVERRFARLKPKAIV